MSTINLQVKLDSKLAGEAKELANNLGFDLPTAVRMFVSQFVRDRKLPFVPGDPDPFYSEENMEFLRRSIEQLKAGHCVEKTMEELERMAQ